MNHWRDSLKDVRSPRADATIFAREVETLVGQRLAEERARIFSGVNELIDFRLRLIARQAMSANGATEADLAAVDMGLNDLRVHLQAEFGIEITLDEEAR